MVIVRRNLITGRRLVSDAILYSFIYIKSFDSLPVHNQFQNGPETTLSDWCT